MASLTGNTIQSTYDSLLKVSDNDSITSTLKRITDGLGNNTPLYLSSVGVEISSGLSVIGALSASNVSGSNTGDETKASIETKLGAATSSNSGYLTSSDWSTFNNKIAGTGTLNKVSKFSSTGSIADSNITDDGSLVNISTATTITGDLTATNIIRSGGTSSQFLKADGSVDSTSYQPLLTNPVTGTGTTNTLPKFTGASAIGNSNITDTGSLITLGSNTNVGTGSLGIGSSSLTEWSLRISKNIIGSGGNAFGIGQDGQIQSSATSNAFMYYSIPTTQATSFTLANLYHYAARQGSLGASSAITNQYGFWVESSLTGATNNFGFYGNIASGTGRWNLYMNGTANNYLAGNLGIGSTALTGYNLRMQKTITGATSAFGITVESVVQSDVTTLADAFRSSISFPSGTLTDLAHFRASGSTATGVTNQYGFTIGGNLLNATNNYGFHSTLGAGTGRWNLYMAGTADNYLAGSLGIGSTTLTGFNLRVEKNITGAGTSRGIFSGGTIQSDVTSGQGFATNLSTQAATFSPYIGHFVAGQGTIGAGSTPVEQYGFLAGSSLTGAASNYGFYGSIAAGSGRWNLYMNGTANNYLAGSLGIGSTSLTGVNFRVSNNITGAATSLGILSDGVVQSTVSNATAYTSQLRTQATAFSLGTFIHYDATQSSIGAGSSVVNQYGFVARNTITGATNNFGFYGGIASGTNRWNLYMEGTAQNYLAGNLGLNTTAPTGLLDINDNKIRVRTAQTPASATAAGNQGEIAWDANYIYVCTATNTWKRVAIATW